MATYLKKASRKIEDSDQSISDLVSGMLNRIRIRGEPEVAELAAKFDNWTRDFILAQDEIELLIDKA